jgi:anti-anti-sigma factor
MTIVALEGEIDLAAAPDAERMIAEAEAGKPAQLIIDLREVTFMDSSGLRVLLTAHRRAEEAGRRFAVVRGGEAVHRLLEVTGLTDRLELLDEPPATAGGPAATA